MGKFRMVYPLNEMISKSDVLELVNTDDGKILTELDNLGKHRLAYNEDVRKGVLLALTYVSRDVSKIESEVIPMYFMEFDDEESEDE